MLTIPRTSWCVVAVLAFAGCDQGSLRSSDNLDPDPDPLVPPPPPPPEGETFEELKARLEAEKPEVMARQQALLEARYDLADRPMEVTMTRGKPVQAGIRVRLTDGHSWDELAAMTPAQIKEAGLFPAGFMPLPHRPDATSSASTSTSTCPTTCSPSSGPRCS